MSSSTSQENVLKKIRTSCRRFIDQRKETHVHVCEDSIETFIRNLTDGKKRSKSHQNYIDLFLTMLEEIQKILTVEGSTMPLLFDSKDQEINFLSILQLLNFGSGYRNELHEKTGRGSYETICFGLINLHVSSTPLDAKFMKTITPQMISSYFDLPLKEEKEILPSVYISQDSC
jgi:hypothetical protein